ncbi:MAG: DUF4403 family protein [Rhizobiales bacterium]|nr:DUF4403 family protein [Hyphomicrobiales bacterium]
MRFRTILVGIAVLAMAFVGATLAMQVLWPAAESSRRVVLADVPPLPAVSRTSTIVAPTVVTLGAIREMLETTAPRDLTGTSDNPVSKLLSNAEIGWTVNRGPLGVFGKPDVIGVSTVLTGTLRATGQISTQAAGSLRNAVTGLLGQDVGRNVEKLAGRTLDQRTDVRGNAAVVSQPVLTPAWRLEPNLTTQFSIADANIAIAGVRLNVSNEVRPLLERQVNEQVARLQARLRNDPFLEHVARREWAKLCRSLAIGAAGSGMPNLWLEFRPKRAIAAQPRVDAEAVTLLVGVEAETRIVPKETKPECPFPATLEIVPQTEQGRVNIAVPIDVPFTEVNRLLEAQLAGKTFPDDNSGALAVTVRRASIAASGDRLLIALRVNATTRKSWFGLGTEANVYVWGRPVLYPKTQMLRLTDVKLDLESEGVLGSAIRAAAPYLESAVAERTVIDLKPFAANARKSIEAAIAEFRTAGDGVRVDASVADLRVVDIAFDATTLRIIAEADGAAKVSVTSLPK